MIPLTLARARAPWWLAVDPRAVLAGLVLLACALIAFGAWTVRIAHEARAARQAICQARLEVYLAQSPLGARWVRPADPCVALTVFAAEARR